MKHFSRPPRALRAPLAPHHDQRPAQSRSQGQLGGGDSVAQVGAAAVPSDGVVHVQDRQGHIYTVAGLYATLVMDGQEFAAKPWREPRTDTGALMLGQDEAVWKCQDGHLQ